MRRQQCQCFVTVQIENISCLVTTSRSFVFQKSDRLFLSQLWFIYFHINDTNLDRCSRRMCLWSHLADVLSGTTVVLLRAHLLQPPVSTPQWTTSLLDERSADVPRLSVQFSPSALQNLVLLSSSAQPVECPTNLQRLPCQHLVVVQTSDQFAYNEVKRCI